MSIHFISLGTCISMWNTKRKEKFFELERIRSSKKGRTYLSQKRYIQCSMDIETTFKDILRIFCDIVKSATLA